MHFVGKTGWDRDHCANNKRLIDLTDCDHRYRLIETGENKMFNCLMYIVIYHH